MNEIVGIPYWLILVLFFFVGWALQDMFSLLMKAIRR